MKKERIMSQNVKRRILLVDDEIKNLDELREILCPDVSGHTDLRELEKQLFGDAGNSAADNVEYHVVCCRQGEDAVRQAYAACQQGEPFMAAFLDVRMPPGIDGVCVAEEIRKVDRDMEIVIMTGYTDYDISQINQRIKPADKLLYLQKPIHAPEARQLALALTTKWLMNRQIQSQNQSLLEAYEKLKDHDRLKSEFVLTVSHELRTPLTIFRNILSNALAGVAGKLPPKLRSNLEMADEAVKRLTSIISDFLDISKLDLNKMKLRQEVTSIQTLVKKITDMLRLMTDSRGIAMQVNMPVEENLVFIDYEKMAQVLTNLIDNAAKFVPEQGGKISVEVMDRMDSIRVCIRDNGPGVPEEDCLRIFDRFEQVEKNLTAQKPGTGLGLAICKELVNMHGGRIWVENIPGGGANFQFSLPKHQPTSKEIPNLAGSGIKS
jgi:two-component system, NtrC family, sensor kinase